MRIGSDPELFLVDGGGKFISAIDRIGGTKDFPRPISDDGCAVQEDNVAVEFNIPPSETVEQFIKGINFNLNYLTKHVKTMGLNLAIVASAEFPDDQLMDMRALEFGCDPDYNCWTKRRNPSPKAASKSLRSAGGHVHIGCREADLNPWEVGKAADLFLGVPSVLMDEDQRRRELYGKAGSVRIKPYGVEYRTLSNFWLKSDELKSWVFRQAQRAAEFVQAGNELSDEDGKMIQECINTTNRDLSRVLSARFNIG